MQRRSPIATVVLVATLLVSAAAVAQTPESREPLDIEITVERHPSRSGAFLFQVAVRSGDELLAEPTVVFRRGETASTTLQDSGLDLALEVSMDKDSPRVEYSLSISRDQVPLLKQKATVSVPAGAEESRVSIYPLVEPYPPSEGIVFRAVQVASDPVVDLSLIRADRQRVRSTSFRWAGIAIMNRWYRRIENVEIGVFVYTAEGERAKYVPLTVPAQLPPLVGETSVWGPLRRLYLEPGSQVFLAVEAWSSDRGTERITEAERERLVEQTDRLARDRG